MLSFDSDDVLFDEILICFLSGLLLKAYQSSNHKEKHIISKTQCYYVFLSPFYS